MKRFIYIVLAGMLFSCTQSGYKTGKQNEDSDDNFESIPENNYKPGFGEIMGDIQIHHSKLWFAGINSNWKLAEFEVHELKEMTEDIENYQNDREESKYIEMIYPAFDSVSVAIAGKNKKLFINSYNFLTGLCNECHKLTGYQFIMLKVPENGIFDNQEFDINNLPQQ